MKDLLLFDKSIYKIIKNYKKLDEHHINGEIINIKNIILDNRTIVLKFYNTHLTNTFKSSSKIISYKNLIKNKIIYYDVNIKKLIFNNIIKVWYNNQNLNIFKPILPLYLNNKYINKKQVNTRNIFQKIEKKPFFLLYKEQKFFFLYYNILLKIHLWNYDKTKIKQFFINFINDQNILFIKKKIYKNKSIKLKSIVIGIDKNNFIIYTPELFKISIISFFTLKKEFRIILKKWIKKNMADKKKYKIHNLKKKQQNLLIDILRKVFISNFYCKIHPKKIL